MKTVAIISQKDGAADSPKTNRSFRKAALADGVLTDIEEWKSMSSNTGDDA